MWTQACQLIRPPLLWSVSENTCWTWFPPDLSPKQPTRGNNAIFLSTDNVTFTPPNINNSHSHYRSNSFYGPFPWPKRLRRESTKSCVGCNRRSLFSLIYFSPIFSHSIPSSLSGVELLQLGPLGFKGVCHLEVGYLLGVGALQGQVQFHKLLQQCCICLPVYWLKWAVAAKRNLWAPLPLD